MRNPIFCFVGLLCIGIFAGSPFLYSRTTITVAPPSTQDTTLRFYVELNGSIRQMKDVMGDSGDNPWLDSAIVTVYYDKAVYTKVYTSRRGKCSFQLPLDREYIVELSKPGFVAKKFQINTKTPPNKKDVYDFYFDMNIFESVDGLDTKVLEKPIAMVYFNITNNQFEYDAAYTNRINSDLKLMYRNYYILDHSPKKKKKR